MTDISADLIPEQNKIEMLRSELDKLNMKLPSNVYIPLCTKKIRESIVLFIPSNEARVFVTNKKAPFLIAVEIFDPLEIAMEPNTKIISTELSPRNAKLQLSMIGIGRHSAIYSSFYVSNDDLDKRLNDALSDYINPMKHKKSKKTPPITIDNYRKLYKKGMLMYILGLSESPNRLLKQNITSTLSRHFSRDDTWILENLSENKGIELPEEDTKSMVRSTLKLKLLPFEEDKEEQSSFEEANKLVIEDEPTENKKLHDLMEDNPFGELYEEQCERIRKKSPYGKLMTWRLIKIIVKKGCDLRQEQFAMQLISQCHQIFKKSKIKIWLKPYEIMSTGPNCGLLEFIDNTVSLDSLNKKLSKAKIKGLPEFFRLYFRSKKELKKAKKNFARSMAGYSLICYLLQIRDRHDANIMLDNKGHIMHIDFDFFMSNAPGGAVESAPFKFTGEFMEVLGGEKSKYFKLYKNLMIDGFIELQKGKRRIITLVTMMQKANKNLPCFVKGSEIIPELEKRLFPKIEGDRDKYEILNKADQ